MVQLCHCHDQRESRTFRLDKSLLLITWTKALWRKGLWSDGTKTELLDHNNQKYVWRREGKALNPKPTIKHDDSILLWGCSAASGTDALHNGIMKKDTTRI